MNGFLANFSTMYFFFLCPVTPWYFCHLSLWIIFLLICGLRFLVCLCCCLGHFCSSTSRREKSSWKKPESGQGTSSVRKQEELNTSSSSDCPGCPAREMGLITSPNSITVIPNSRAWDLPLSGNSRFCNLTVNAKLHSPVYAGMRAFKAAYTCVLCILERISCFFSFTCFFLSRGSLTT